MCRRLLVLALSLTFLVLGAMSSVWASPSSSDSQADLSSLPPFEDGRLYSVTGPDGQVCSVPGWMLNMFRTPFLEAKEQLTEASTSFARYRTKTVVIEVGLGTLAVAGLGLSVYEFIRRF